MVVFRGSGNTSVMRACSRNGSQNLGTGMWKPLLSPSPIALDLLSPRPLQPPTLHEGSRRKVDASNVANPMVAPTSTRIAFSGCPGDLEIEDESLIRSPRKITYFGKLPLNHDLAIETGK